VTEKKSKPSHLERLWPYLCMIVAAYFGLAFLVSAGWPPITAKEHWILLAMFVLFAFVPFVKEIDVFQLISIKRDIKEVKDEVGDAKEKVAEVREQMRQIMNSQQTLVSSVQTMTVSSQRNETHVHYDSPTPNQVQLAEKAVARVPPTPIEFVEKIKPDDPTVTNDNVDEAMLALMSDSVALLRMKVEKEMKDLARKAGYSQAYPINRASLVRFLVENNHLKGSGLDSLQDAVNVFFRIANGVVHGDEVPFDDMEHAKYLGERLLTIFTEND
jgi:hypothetical protein